MTDQAVFDIFCWYYQFKQTNRILSLLPTLQAKLFTVFQPQFEVYKAEIICKQEGGRTL